MTVDDLMLAAQPQVDGMWRRDSIYEVHRDTLLSGLKITPCPLRDRGQRFRAAIAGTLMDLDVDTMLIHATSDDVEQATLSAAIALGCAATLSGVVQQHLKQSNQKSGPCPRSRVGDYDIHVPLDHGGFGEPQAPHYSRYWSSMERWA